LAVDEDRPLTIGWGCFTFLLGFFVGLVVAFLLAYWTVTWVNSYDRETPSIVRHPSTPTAAAFFDASVATYAEVTAIDE
jgi:hypothetical protein